MNFQGTAWNWGGWWEPIGVGREARGSRRGGEWWEKPLGPLGPHWEGRWRRWPSGRGREKMTSSFELRFVTLQGIWNFRLLQEWPAEYLQPWVPWFPPPPTSLLVGPRLAEENPISGELGSKRIGRLEDEVPDVPFTLSVTTKVPVIY